MPPAHMDTHDDQRTESLSWSCVFVLIVLFVSCSFVSIHSFFFFPFSQTFFFVVVAVISPHDELLKSTPIRVG